MTNMLKRIGAALTRQIERENKATSVNTAPTVEELVAKQGVKPLKSVEQLEGLWPEGHTPAPDWEAIADELAKALSKYKGGSFYETKIKALTHYHTAKQVKP